MSMPVILYFKGNKMSKEWNLEEMMDGLRQAENLVDTVYHYAMETDNDELRHLMNMAGTACNDGHNELSALLKAKMGMSKEEIMSKLNLAQQLLSDVYHDACEKGNSEIESQMSVADSCINDVMGSLE